MTLQRTGGFWSTNWDGSPVQSLSPSFHQYKKDGTTAMKIYIYNILFVYVYIYIYIRAKPLSRRRLKLLKTGGLS